MSDVDSLSAPASAAVAELAAEPDALRWAQECGWLPGTGHCRHRACSRECVFHAQREAEAGRVMRARRQRRPAQGALVDRIVRLASALLPR